AQPSNLFVLTEMAGVAARRGDAAELRKALDRLQKLAPAWSPATRERLNEAERAAAGALPGDVPGALIRFDILLRSEAGYARGKEVRQVVARSGDRATTGALAFPGGPSATAPSAVGVVALDWNNDYRTDLLLAGAGGLRFYQQGADGRFADVTEKTGLATDILGADYFGGWAADIEMDGDVDIIVAPRAGA